MAYLKQFARNRRGKENTKVLTARLPESMYDELQNHCDSLGLSLSEAIYLLVEKEVRSIQQETRSLPKETKTNEDEHKTNTGETNINTNTGEINTLSKNNAIKANSNSPKKSTANSKRNTGRFTVKSFIINNELPCPICDTWLNSSNFSRHAKTLHNSNTESIFTEYKDKVAEMIESKTAELGTNEGE
jgi:antitoxin component of RelBE/YafQ-DinJ toxin-antitoxin module